MEHPEILGEDAVHRFALELPDSRFQMMARSHERLRAMLVEAAERIGKQSDLLSQRAEKGEGK